MKSTTRFPVVHFYALFHLIRHQLHKCNVMLCNVSQDPFLNKNRKITRQHFYLTNAANIKTCSFLFPEYDTAINDRSDDTFIQTHCSSYKLTIIKR